MDKAPYSQSPPLEANPYFEALEEKMTRADALYL